MTKNKQITDWDSFCELANKLTDNFTSNANIFRGQSDKDWLLEHSLSRFLKRNKVVDKQKALDIENEMLKILYLIMIYLDGGC